MLRFMCVGDSQTIGSAGEHTWRYRLWEHLRDTLDAPFRFVGPRETLYDTAQDAPVSLEYPPDTAPAFPRAHLAGWGEGWLHMAPLIREAVTAHRPGVLLVSLGLIDLGFYTDAGQTAANVRAFVTEARAANPRVRFLILPVVPNVRAQTDTPFGAELAHFNELLAKTAADLDTPRSPVLLAAPPTDYDLATDTHDGTHPGASGAHKLAAAFARALHEEWGWGESYESAEESRGAGSTGYSGHAEHWGHSGW
ncbi:SGNH/GDSL hydrolase family protein [Streptomyces sp. NPDC059816]|uniref:SGNH/GDSL hydrolase family protein n=1 Tax=Streptomyces sp. NPDC059816 TaxID=3346960 RepID=UPI003649590C